MADETSGNWRFGITKIVSGGQTGADRAALDVALELGIACGGWVPKGRLAEDGRIPERYPNLVEADSPEEDDRTALNVRDSDATLIISRGPLTGGSAYTLETADRLGKPHKHVDLMRLTIREAVAEIRRWLEDVRPRVLNVAGPRASKDAGIHDRVCLVLRDLLSGVE
jgi:hypothetical protein